MDLDSTCATRERKRERGETGDRKEKEEIDERGGR
jgi:hypothetical protein